jgi:sulfide dehydrogenase cytochrome subunit
MHSIFARHLLRKPIVAPWPIALEFIQTTNKEGNMGVRVPGMALVASLLPAAALAQTAGPSGEAMVQTCYVCHGPDGKSAGPIASLAGLPKDHIARQLTEFKTDRRPGTIMNRIAKIYSDEQIVAIAEFIATLK